MYLFYVLNLLNCISFFFTKNPVLHYTVAYVYYAHVILATYDMLYASMT